jgi:hypothetical protein
LDIKNAFLYGILEEEIYMKHLAMKILMHLFMCANLTNHYMASSKRPEHGLQSFFANRTLALKETPNSIKHPKKNENYNEILEKPFIFKLQSPDHVDDAPPLPLLPQSA